MKSLLPELQNSTAPKVSVLQCAVDTLKRRAEYANTIQQQNAHLRGMKVGGGEGDEEEGEEGEGKRKTK